ncbi:heterokaryon incompatibility protein-domain-containing protein [Rostrohypoxylon terebratum]|nr:heterokaryon incompatibility protein-domain-containing protein [Rostrohypoxylon terebratum]
MWLIHASSMKIEYFNTDDDYPPYAILSHTWGEEEISFQDWQGTDLSELEHRKGYQKILYCCTQALQDCLEWVWVDTCCIDKTSSAELSESINSMFRWYQNSTFCYAYLSDVSRDTPLVTDSEFSRSRWHTRGWTLQELIAPKVLFFFSKDWSLLGTKYELSELLHSITHIEPRYLDGSNLDLASAAKKMSWASNRNTSRVEDIAYCLLGIFDINMPLIYGEGKNAFRRLQEEIIKIKFDDHSIFAWGTIVSTPTIEITDRNILWGRKGLEWSRPKQLLGLLAESPRDFSNSGMFMPSPMADEFYRHLEKNVAALPVLAGSEIRIQLPVVSTFDSIYHWKWPGLSQIREGTVVALLCCHEQHPTWLLRVPLQNSVHRNYGRTNELLFDESLDTTYDHILSDTRLLHVAPEKQRILRCGDIIIRRNTFNHALVKYAGFQTHASVTYFESEQVVTMNSDQFSPEIITFSYKLKEMEWNFGFNIHFKRNGSITSANYNSDLNLQVSLMPVFFNDSRHTQERVLRDGVEWWDYRNRLKQYDFPSVDLTCPLGAWGACFGNWGKVCIQVERVFIDLGSFVDVVDIYLEDRSIK